GPISISGPSTVVTFDPGVYVLQAGMSILTGATVSGTNVTFYSTGGGNINVDQAQATVNLSAPNSGSNEGILFFQNRTSTASLTVGSDATVNLQGVVYMRSGSVSWWANSSNSAYTVWVVDTFVLHGGGTVIQDNFSVLANGSPIKTVSLAQ